MHLSDRYLFSLRYIAFHFLISFISDFTFFKPYQFHFSLFFFHSLHRFILKLFDRNLNTCKFLIPDLNADLWHRRSISCLCMLFKIYHNPTHPLHSELPSLFHPVRETRNVVHSHSHSFSVARCSTAQYSRCLIPA